MRVAYNILILAWLAKDTYGSALPINEEVSILKSCPLSRTESCALPKTAEEVRHVIMLSGPRHGTSFIMSLLSDSGGTLYLGELLNSKMPFAHANIVNSKNILNVMNYLNLNLPGAREHKPSIRKLQQNLSPRIALHLEMTRQRIEDFAVLNGFHTLLYKLFGNYEFVENVKRKRCTHFLHLKRNMLQVHSSLLEVQEGAGKFTNSNSGDVFNLNISSLARELKRDMQREMWFRRASVGGIGANVFIQYEEVLGIEDADARADPPKTMEESLHDVKAFVVARLDKSLSESSMRTTIGLGSNTSVNIGLQANNPSKANVMCPFHLSTTTTGLYTRQDTRPTFESKVGNYAVLQKFWWDLCLVVAEELGQDQPEKTCRETTWNLPK